MVIDTSALLAIAFNDPSREFVLKHIQYAQCRFVSAVSLLEAGIVFRARLGHASVSLLYNSSTSSRGEPVLATGNDFAATDLIVVRSR